MASNNVCDLFEEARFAVMFARNSISDQRFIQPHEVLRAATFGGAAALGLDQQIGTLDAGKQADLIVVSLANLAQLPVHDVNSAIVFATNARDVRLTVVGGEEIMRDGEFGRVDLREIRNEFDLLVARMT